MKNFFLITLKIEQLCVEESFSVLSIFWVLPSHLLLQIRAAVRTVLVARLKNPVMVALCQKGIVANYILVYYYWLLELDDLGVTSFRNNRIQHPLVVLRAWLMLGVCVYRYTYICVCVFIYMYVCMYMGLPQWLCGKEPTCQCRRKEMQVRSLGGEDPLWRAWQPTPEFLPGEPHGQRSLAGNSP